MFPDKRFIIRFITLFLAQVILFQPMQLIGEVHIQVYLLFPILFPISYNKTSILIYSFFLGLFIDIVSNTLGIHTSTILTIALLRPIGLELLNLKVSEIEGEIGWFKISKLKFASFLFVLTLIHQLYFQLLSNLGFWTWPQLGYILKNTILSTIVMILLLAIFENKKKRNKR